MKEILDSGFLGQYLTPEILKIAGGVLGVLIIVGMIKRLLRKKGDAQHFETVGCLDCGWHGQVSRWAGRCPQCNKPLGEQKARSSK